MKDVVSDKLSQAQLSKFENGQTMLSADKLLTAISAIHMSFAEFEHAYYQYEDSSFFKQAKLISKYHSNKNIEGLEKLLIIHDNNSETYDVYDKLNKLVIRCAIHDLNPEYIISDDDKDFITTYLYSIEEWTEYELYIFGNTLQVLSDSDLIFLSKSFIERDSLYLSIPNNNFRTQLVVLNIIFVLLERKKDYCVHYFMKHLESILTYQDMFVKTTFIFLKKVLNYREGKGTHLIDLKKYIHDVEELGHEDVAEFLKDNIVNLL
ncbi:putative transcriptional regulator MutR [Streptococcus mutans]|uniref:Putative transcriptional regulator MutR n=2 Tax=Streptococcus mutans TaxID=1309 RepID=A0A829BFR0_STRMG|nr:putative transcriptional regulator MutR [Streptococcus mutans 3SN1]EMB79436.1 putative transcriptional regulator MutR [Streptococcus mutans 11VS1]EMB96768.1 putative transcriptional regulator MutR [Streptococcus mutans M21]EMC06904.1 putative transcriptional regulator MutR [Streptococcus mutans NLML9]EMC21031.1 putative transcriptional regulator MutR [Streptococcus mutans SF14]EMC22753.1 putative transcriptional regulator MutR [Streptococcus mutans SM6]EMC31258.1 putative transcriptional r